MLTESQIKERLFAFDSLQYTTKAFIDYRIPGCEGKKNYALIGSGVSQSPDQPVCLREPHGFQVGGISLPHGKINPPHMHFTAEVFICTKGPWQLQWGFDPEPTTAELGEGDICSVPTWIYRGFKNLGPDDAFMFTALGRDDPGGILWGPSALEAAREQGVHLTDDYRIVDEQLGQTLLDSDKRLQPMTLAEIDALRKWTPVQMMRRVVRFADLDWSGDALLDSVLPGCGAQMAPVIGLGMTQNRNHAAQISSSHGFSIEWLKIPVGGSVSCHSISEKQVLVVYRGSMEIMVEAVASTVHVVASGSPEGWDSYAMPASCTRSYRNKGNSDVIVLIMTAGDGRKTISWSEEVIVAAGAKDCAVDADGFVGVKRYIDRSQR